MTANTGKIPLKKYIDPQTGTWGSALPGKIFTYFAWGLIFVLSVAVCFYYSLTKPIVITSANVSDEKIFDLKDTIPLSLSAQTPSKTVVFTVPEGVSASDILTENLYNERRFLVHVCTESSTYYGSLSPTGIPVDAGRVSGDSGLVKEVGVIYDKTGALLIFDMSGVYEYSLTMNDNTVTMEAVNPGDIYDYIVVMDSGTGDEVAGVAADVADRCAKLLYPEGIRVYITDPDLAPGECVPASELVNETDADIYIGLGVSHDGTDHHGLRTWYDSLYYVPGYGSIELCESCLKNTAIETSNRALGISEAPEGSVLYDIDMPAVYMTLGNADNPDEAELMREDSYRDRLARGLYKAVMEAAGMMGDSEG